MPATADLLDRAAQHLTHAADLAEPTDPAFAGQIRLAAATLPLGGGGNDHDGPNGPATSVEAADVADLLDRALDCLDQIPPLDGPADLQLCAWHIHELRRIATSGIAS